MEPNKILASVFEVDPATGAIGGGREYVVAYSTNSNDVEAPNYFLSQVKSKLFPEVYLMEDELLWTLRIDTNTTARELREAVNTWTAMPEKSQTPIAVIMSQQFNWNPTRSFNGPQAGTKDHSPDFYDASDDTTNGIEKAMKKILDVIIREETPSKSGSQQIMYQTP